VTHPTRTTTSPAPTAEVLAEFARHPFGTAGSRTGNATDLAVRASSPDASAEGTVAESTDGRPGLNEQPP
jgi:hypothetical protein